MLRFESYPPEQEEDIRITTGAERLLEDASRYYYSSKLYDYGMAMGNMLAASVDSMESTRVKSLKANLGGRILSQANAVILEANDVLGAENYLMFSQGFAQGSLLGSIGSEKEPFVTSTNSSLVSAKS